MVFSRQRGTTRSRRLADRSCCRYATLKVRWQKCIRYCGAWPCMQLYNLTPLCETAISLLRPVYRNRPSMYGGDGDKFPSRAVPYYQLNINNLLAEGTHTGPSVFGRICFSSRFGLSHWDPYAMHRGGCLELYYCNMVEWSWWDSSLI